MLVGTYRIMGREVKLQLDISYNGNVANLTIKLPSDYPGTQLREELGRVDLFAAVISYLSSCCYSQQAMDRFYQCYGIDLAQPRLHIEGITVTGRLAPLTSEERTMMRGLGKRAFCKALPYLANHWHLTPSSPITLLAAGGTVETEEDHQRVDLYGLMSKEELVGRILDAVAEYVPMDEAESIREHLCPSDSVLGSIWQSQIDHGHLMRLPVWELDYRLVMAENNQRLIRYYERAWSMKPIAVDNLVLDMGTSISELEQACHS